MKTLVLSIVFFCLSISPCFGQFNLSQKDSIFLVKEPKSYYPDINPSDVLSEPNQHGTVESIFNWSTVIVKKVKEKQPLRDEFETQEEANVRIENKVQSACNYFNSRKVTGIPFKLSKYDIDNERFYQGLNNQDYSIYFKRDKARKFKQDVQGATLTIVYSMKCNARYLVRGRYPKGESVFERIINEAYLVKNGEIIYHFNRASKPKAEKPKIPEKDLKEVIIAQNRTAHVHLKKRGTSYYGKFLRFFTCDSKQNWVAELDMNVVGQGNRKIRVNEIRNIIVLGSNTSTILNAKISLSGGESFEASFSFCHIYLTDEGSLNGLYNITPSEIKEINFGR